MSRRIAKLLAPTTALVFALTLTTSADAFHGGGGGGHFGGGGFGGGHFGGGHFGGGHFGGMHFGGGHFGGRHFGGFGGHHFAGHFGHTAHFGHFHTHAAVHSHVAHGFGHRNGFGRHVAGFGHTQGAFGHGAFAHGFGHSGFGHRRYGWGWWGWGGGLFWPYYYDDALFFALWPDDYYDPFFDYGPYDLFAGFFWPGYDYPYDYGPAYGEYPNTLYYRSASSRRHARRAHQQLAQTDNPETCAASAPDFVNLPLDRVSQAIQPSAEQTKLLGNLKDATATADDILHNACPSQMPLTPVSRIAAIEKRLDATEQAVAAIRGPLVSFYDSLGDAQKKKFDDIALGGPGRRHRMKENPDSAIAQCKQNSSQLAAVPSQQIADSLKPTGDQKIAFDALKTAMDNASASVESSCPAEPPEGVAARFDAIDARLKAMRDAIDGISPKLKAFYATLTDDQKAQFNLMTMPNPENQNRG